MLNTIVNTIQFEIQFGAINQGFIQKINKVPGKNPALNKVKIMEM